MWWWTAVALASPDQTYVRLRDRLVTDFLVVGSEQGQSVPATRRWGTSMKWADATVQHGWYLGVLAIERALLAEPDALPGFAPRTLAQTDAELKAALDAVDRLDAYPAGAFPACGGAAGALDGFFVRDDVPDGFQAAFDGIDAMESDWIDPATGNKAMSQDQAVHLLMGLALVRRFVTDPDLRAQAASAAARIGAHVAADGEWIIENPECGEVVGRGGNAQLYSDGFAAAIAVASGQPAPAEGLYPELWEAFRDPMHVGFDNSDNRHMVLALVATGDSWDDGWDDLLAVSAVEDWDAYPLLYAALHGAPADDALETRVWADLDALGDADVAATWPDPAGHPWTTWHRYIRPAEDHPAGSDGSGGQAFPGLDWMLLYGLHAAVYRAEWPEEDVGEPQGCGCATGTAPLALGLLVAPLLRRRPAPRPRRPAGPRR